jgi:cell wall-associated NlpC family hydrolase
MYRSTAQGLYELYCTPIAPEDAQSNDLIFFKETLDADGDEIPYVGIYCGEGIMISAGDPVQFSNINTQYYTQHLYGYGRIKEE